MIIKCHRNERNCLSVPLFILKVYILFSGKHFIVPTGTTNAGLATKTASNMFPQIINQQTQNIPSTSTVSNTVTDMNTQAHIINDPAGSKQNMVPLSNHGANFEFTSASNNFDVNDFLNIPPKEQQVNNEGVQNNKNVTKDLNQTPQSDTQLATTVSTSVNSQPVNTEVVVTDKPGTERQDTIAEQPSNTPVHSYQTPVQCLEYVSCRHQSTIERF